MRVFVSVDMEGVAGVATLDQVVRGGSGYPAAQHLMTQEANAAVRGAFAGGASEVVVNDSHGTMDNLLPDLLDRRARVVLGTPRPSCMVQGVQPGDAMAAFIGYHGPAGSRGVLAHTFSNSFGTVLVDGHACSEADVNALLCAAVGVPVGLLAGDDVICERGIWGSPDTAVVPTKRAVGWAAADSVSPDDACAAIEQAVADAVRSCGSRDRAPHDPPRTVEVAFTSPLMADLAAAVPGAERVDGSRVRCAVPGAADVAGLLSTWLLLAAGAARQLAAIAERR